MDSSTHGSSQTDVPNLTPNDHQIYDLVQLYGELFLGLMC